MLKYLYYKEVFREIPDEISLGISISGCKIRCDGCHSMELWEDKGSSLTIESITELLNKYSGASCILLLGGEHSIAELKEIFKYFFGKIKTAWYCGLDEIPSEHADIENYLDFLKIGHYNKNLGGLDSLITNQKLYKIVHTDNGYYRKDITPLLIYNK